MKRAIAAALLALLLIAAVAAWVATRPTLPPLVQTGESPAVAPSNGGAARGNPALVVAPTPASDSSSASAAPAPLPSPRLLDLDAPAAGTTTAYGVLRFVDTEGRPVGPGTAIGVARFERSPSDEEPDEPDAETENTPARLTIDAAGEARVNLDAILVPDPRGLPSRAASTVVLFVSRVQTADGAYGPPGSGSAHWYRHGPREPETIVCIPLCRLVVRVASAAGEAVTGAAVRIRMDDSFHEPPEATTGPDGAVAFPDVYAGEARVTVVHEPTHAYARVEAVIDPRDPELLVRLRRPPRLGSIEVSFVDAAGVTIAPWGSLELTPWSGSPPNLTHRTLELSVTATGARLDDVVPGTYALAHRTIESLPTGLLNRLYSTRLAQVKVEVPSGGSAAVPLATAVTGRVRGRVLEGGKVVPQARVYVRCVAPGCEEVSGDAFCDDEGRFEGAAFGLATYQVQGNLDDQVTADLRPPAPREAEVTLEVSARGDLRVTLKGLEARAGRDDVDSDPYVYAWRAGHGRETPDSGRESGASVHDFHRLVPGRYTVAVEDRSVEVDVAAGVTATVEVTLAPPPPLAPPEAKGALEVHVAGRLAGVPWYAAAYAGRRRVAWSLLDARQCARLEVPPGAYDVVAFEREVLDEEETSPETLEEPDQEDHHVVRWPTALATAQVAAGAVERVGLRPEAAGPLAVFTDEEPLAESWVTLALETPGGARLACEGPLADEKVAPAAAPGGAKPRSVFTVAAAGLPLVVGVQGFQEERFTPAPGRRRDISLRSRGGPGTVVFAPVPPESVSVTLADIDHPGSVVYLQHSGIQGDDDVASTPPGRYRVEVNRYPRNNFRFTEALTVKSGERVAIPALPSGGGSVRVFVAAPPGTEEDATALLRGPGLEIDLTRGMQETATTLPAGAYTLEVEGAVRAAFDLSPGEAKDLGFVGATPPTK